VIAGPDHAHALRFPAAEIPKVNGMRLLYKKMVGLVGHFAGPEIVADVRRTLLYECDKTFVEICTALVLLAGAYVPSYRERDNLFARHWQIWFPDLVQRLPDLDVQISRATQEKLFPGSTSPLPPYESFIRAREALLEVHRFCASSLYGIEVVPGLMGCALLRQMLKKDYFRVAVAEWLGQRRLDCAPARWALNHAYHYLLRHRFARGMDQRGASMIWQTIGACEGPPLDIFLAAWCALAAIGDTPDSALLGCADQALGRLPGMAMLAHAPSGWEGYQATRGRIVQAYSTWEHHR
jgi:hypothetical protein